MADFRGIEDFVAAITGGGNATEAAAYNTGLDRLTRQRSQQALLDKRIEQAAREKNINDNRGQLDTLIPDDVLRALTLSNAGASYSSAQTGIGTGQKNEARQGILDAVMSALGADGEISPDVFNALNAIASGKLLTPSNVQVNDQAASDISVSDSVAALNALKGTKIGPEIDAINALTGQRNAAAEKSARPTSNAAFNLELPSKDQIALLDYVGPETTEPGMLGGLFGDKTIPGEPGNLLEEFLSFQAANIDSDPRLRDSNYAIAKFLEMDRANQSKVAGQSEAPSSAAIKFVRGPDGSLVIQQ